MAIISSLDLEVTGSPLITELQILQGIIDIRGGASVAVSTTAPISPAVGAEWFDPEYGVTSVWDGTAWVGQDELPIAIAPVLPVPPVLSAVTATPGDGQGELFATSDQDATIYLYVSLSPTPEDPADIIAETGTWIDWSAQIALAGDPVTTTVFALANDVLHYFHAMAVNGDGDQSEISTVSFTPTAGVIPLGAELLVKFVDQTSGASAHRIYVGGVLTVTLTAGDTEHNLTGLAWNTAYAIVIRSWDGVTESNPLTATVYTAPEDAPSLAATALGDSSIALEIVEPTVTPASVNAGTGYSIEQSSDGITGWAQIELVAVGNQPAPVTGLPESTARYFRARSVNGNPSPHDPGYSAYSATVSDTTDADISEPTILSATVNGTALTIVFDEPVTFGAGGSGGFAIDISGGTQNIAATYASGDTMSTVVFTLATAVSAGDVLALQYTQPGDGWQDMSLAGNLRTTFTAQAVTNATPSFILGYNPVLWLDASDSTTLRDSGGSPASPDEDVATWQDKSSGGLHFTQTSPGVRPVRKTEAQNGLDVVRFETGDLLLRDVISNAVEYTMFVVLKYSVTSTDYSIAFLNGNGSTDGSGLITLSGSRALLFGGVGAPTGGTATTNCEVWTSRRTSNNVFLSVDGVNQTLSSATSNLNAPSTNSFVAAGTFQGDIMEVIFFDTSLATEDQAAIEAYLVDKWIP